MYSDVELVRRALGRIRLACRARPMPTRSGPPRPSQTQVELLEQLDRRDPVMVTELAAHQGVTPSTMSITLRRLERDGYVSRDRDPEDRRVVNVRLTEAGEQLRDAWSPLDPSRVDAVLGTLTLEERRRAIAGLSLLADAADTALERPGA